MESSSSGHDASEDFSDTIFWFLHENSSFISGSSSQWDDCDLENQESIHSELDEKTAFWDAQEQQLLATLCRTTRMESRVRKVTEEGLKESAAAVAAACRCRRGSAASCRSCLMEEVLERLCIAGFQCSIRKSKWKRSSKTPSGEHTYLEVVEEKKGRVIVELHFRAEFEMARGSDHYNRLLSHLPEAFVGRPEKLRNVVGIMCGAARRCIKENKMHVPPWRKLKYMQSKWLSTSTTSEIPESATSSDPPPQEKEAGRFSGGRRPRASLLTSALLGNLPGSRCQVVAVV